MYDNLTRTNLEFAYQKAEKRIEELERKLERTEKGCKTCTKFDEVKLTKAKELLERFLGLGNLWNLDCKDYFPLRKEVTQFLQEMEE